LQLEDERPDRALLVRTKLEIARHVAHGDNERVPRTEGESVGESGGALVPDRDVAGGDAFAERAPS
jgi:hypothetical protein